MDYMITFSDVMATVITLGLGVIGFFMKRWISDVEQGNKALQQALENTTDSLNEKIEQGNRNIQEKIQKNMLQISLRKNLILSQRIFCTTPKTIRERVLTYLTAQSLKADGEIFEIPFNRQQMAEYLNLDRSALSKELGKMKQEGILDFHKNMFRILKKGSVE